MKPRKTAVASALREHTKEIDMIVRVEDWEKFGAHAFKAEFQKILLIVIVT